MFTPKSLFIRSKTLHALPSSVSCSSYLGQRPTAASKLIQTVDRRLLQQNSGEVTELPSGCL